MKVLHYISILLLLLSLAACKDSRIEDLTEQRVLGDSLYVQLSLDLSNNSATRANPNGGEQGDGWEYGYDYENSIYDFCLFVLDGNNINDDATTSFVAARYFNHDEVLTATTSLEEIPLKGVNKNVFSYVFNVAVPLGTENISEFIENEERLRQLRFIIAANVGNIVANVTTLGVLRDFLPEKSFEPGETIAQYSNFVMSNENDAIYYNGYGTLDSPVRLHVTIERLAARIDFKRDNYSRISNDGKSLVYQLKNSESTLLSELYLDELQIVNGSIQPSYLIKRVANDINGTNLTYLGDETPTPNGVATNYVIDPYSAQKTDANRTNTTLLTTLFGTTPTPRFDLDPTKDNQILGYVNENTFDSSCTFAEYTTGVQLKCRFVPMHNYYSNYNAETDVLTEGTYSVGETFYMVELNTPAINESERLYFKNKLDADAYATNTAKGHFGKVVKYEGGVCYYYVYMRHSNKVEVVHNTMEFGIVRNNIYRFSIDAATGPGTPEPDPRHPEELKARIYVNKWVSVEHPIIYV